SRADDPQSSDTIGAPKSVAIEPGDIPIVGRRATRQLIATGTYEAGSVRDLTRLLTWSSLDPSVATISEKAQLRPVSNGTVTVVAKSGSVESQASLTITGLDQPVPVSFRRDVIPAFSQAGCNMGACHGTPTGKGGFRLSLRGYLPDQDYQVLSREVGGRRINPIAAETSMILRKPLGEIPHEGGLRLSRSAKTYEFLHDWIQEGAKDDPKAPLAVGLQILPESRVLRGPAVSQQLIVFVRDAAGTRRDVTPICYYDSSNPEIAEVDAEGHVRFKARGEVAIIAHYLNLVAN